MKTKYIFIASLLLLYACKDSKKTEEKQPETVAQQNVQKDTFRISEVIPSVRCKTNETYSFALYLPRQCKGNSKLPALIFCDPHGDGSFPVSRYHGLAEKFGVILIGSNDVKNGLTFNQTSPILQTLVNEIAMRFNIDPGQISLAGFSGGAKAALVAASEIPALASVIYSSAGLQQIPQPLPPALAITGLRDMGYTDVVATDDQMENLKLRHAIVVWNGKHEWGDSATFQNAFYWLKFRAIEKKTAGPDESLTEEFIKQNSQVKSNPVEEKMRLTKLIYFLNGVTDVSKYQAELASIIKQKNYLAAEEKRLSDLQTESRLKENYVQCMDLKDLFWWHTESNRLKTSKKNYMDDRVLGYISLACYSRSSAAIKQVDIQRAQKYISIYSLVDPDNADRAYLQACLYALGQNKVGAIQSLKDAVRLGFSDKAKLMNDDSFASIRNSAEFNEVLQEMN